MKESRRIFARKNLSEIYRLITSGNRAKKAAKKKQARQKKAQRRE